MNSNLKKRALLIAAFVALFLIGREAGFVNLYLFSFSADSKTQSDHYGADPKTVTSETTTQERHYGLGVQASSDSPLFVDLRDEIARNLKQHIHTPFTVEEAAMTGLYWLPLLKSGSSQYRVRLGSVDTGFTLELKGTTDFDCSGLSSVRTLKQSLAAEIATRVVKSLEDATRK